MALVNAVLLTLRPESVQVQLVSYKCQSGHKLFSDQCKTNGHNFMGSECHTGTQA